jgi:NAD+ synthase (glutamine-hydrolysing)
LVDRFDLRPFLYPGMYDNYGFKKIDEMVEKIEAYNVKKVE